MKKIIILIILIISLTGCAHFQRLLENDTGSVEEMVPAQKVEQDTEINDGGETEVISFHSNQKSTPRHIPVKLIHNENRDGSEDWGNPLDVVNEARKIALKEPTKHDIIDGMAVYDYFPNALYKVYCATFRATDILLAPGEKLLDVTAGDTVRWHLYNTSSGEGENRREHIIIKPLKPELTNNIIILTNLYTYYIEAHSTKNTYQMAVSWNYPQSFFKKMKKRQKKEKDERETLITTTNLSFNYEIIDKRGVITRWFGKDIVWRPLRVFDDGLKTFIQFPSELKSSEAPALFVSSHGNTQLVNYRVKGSYYIVDRLFDEAQLIVGEEKPTVIEIKKKS